MRQLTKGKGRNELDDKAGVEDPWSIIAQRFNDPAFRPNTEDLYGELEDEGEVDQIEHNLDPKELKHPRNKQQCQPRSSGEK